MYKPGKAFPPQVAFGHDVYHSDKNKLGPQEGDNSKLGTRGSY